MTVRIAYFWRVIRTAFGFSVFGAAVPMFGIGVLVVARLRSPDPEQRQLFVQRAVHHACRLYLRWVESMGVLRLDVDRPDRLRAPGPHLVVANHPTLIDAIALFASMPQADCIVSRERAGNPILHTCVRECGYVSNDRGSQIVATCAERLQSGRSLIVFPEGTRSPVGGLHRFQRGAAHIAITAASGGIPVRLVPVAIRCDPPTLAKGQKWYDVPDRRFTLTLSVGEPIVVEPEPGIEGGGPIADGGVASPLAARRLTALLRETLEKALGRDLGDVPGEGRDGEETEIGDVGVA